MDRLPTNHTFAPGDAIGIYVVKRLLGSGGMGSVYHAVHKDVEELEVAVKVLKVDPSADLFELVERMFEECRALAKLEKAKHQGLVGINHADKYRGLPYLTMPFVDGRTLDVLIDDGKVGELEAVRVCGEAADAIAAAHALGIVHRDVKPKNVMVTPSGEVKVVDFGISKIIGNNPGLSGVYDSVFGSMPYMAPERLDSILTNKEVGDEMKCDVYSLGILLHECLTGGSDFPTEERSQRDTVQKYLDWTPREIANPEINKIIRQMLERNPMNRLSAKQAAFLLKDAYGRLTASSQTGYFRRPGAVDIDMLVDYIEGDGRDLFGVREAVGPLIFVREDLYAKLEEGVKAEKNQLLTTESRGKEAYTLGRGDACDLVLQHASVSREHAVVEVKGDEYVLLDKSSNGTLVNEERVGSGKRVSLVSGDKVRFARAGLYVFAHSAESLRSLKRKEEKTRRIRPEDLEDEF